VNPGERIEWFTGITGMSIEVKEKAISTTK
jgi:hypothetical protein